jgi:hypothetical protein
MAEQQQAAEDAKQNAPRLRCERRRPPADHKLSFKIMSADHDIRESGSVQMG